MRLEVGEHGDGLVPDEEREHFLEMAQAGLVLLWVSQDLEAEGDQLVPVDFNRPGFLTYFILLLVGLEVEQPLCLGLDVLGYLLLDLAEVLFVLGLGLEEKLDDLVFLIAEDLVGCVGGPLGLDVVEVLVGDVVGERDHLMRE